MITRIMTIILLIVLFTPRHLCAQLSRKLYMSRCLSSEPFMHLHKTSVDGCSKACAERNHCVAIGYHKVSKMCQLYGVITAMLPCVGFVVILKSDFPAGGASTCSGSCPISDCTTIPSINNAEMSGNLLDIGAAVKVQCLNDDGVSYIECQPNGQWTPLPTCSDAAVSCGTPSGILNSDVTHSSTSVGSVATYACQSGYSSSPSGASMSITCLNTAQWETASFTCQQVDCGSPSNVGNSQKTVTSTLAGASATYTCDSGYTVSPSGTSMSINCLNTGQWETISFTCQQVDCGSPSDVGNAQKTFTSTLVGASATYTCDSGYTVSPSGTSMSINCLNTGQWETISFTCQQVGCGTPPDVGNSQKTFTTTTAGSSVIYTCDSGYTVSPSGTTMSINCLNTAQLESISFTCQQVDCGTPSNVGNSQKTVTSTLAGASATYTCNSGYTVSPSGTSMSINCLNTGQWETISFTCQQVDCGTPSNVGNSQKTVTSTLAGASATYTCDSGYTVSPSGTSMSINCLNTGQWETISFTCQQVDCGTPSNVGNSQKTVTSTLEGASATYTCDSGYTVSPSGTSMSINCLNTGQWETISFTCQQVGCGTPPDVGNSQKTFTTTTAGSSVIYTCDSGYTVSPSGTTMSINCLNTAQWESISFTCQQVDCGTPSNVGNSQKTVTSTLAGASATYTCNSGYTVSPSGTSMSINCLNTGQWETISFTCQQVDCGSPSNVGNSQKTVTSTLAGASATYTCDSGYTVSPAGTSMSINCLNTGQWETISFTCQQVDCGSPSDVGNSQKTVTSTLAGASATYTCDSGYTVSPSGTSMSINCLNTGQWETISFTCQQVDCGSPSNVGNSQKTVTSTLAGASATYTCNSGYTVSPSGTSMSINCLNTGQWETISFTCQQVDCGTPSNVGNSQKTVTSTLAGASVTYTCDSGYTVSPSGTSMSINCLNTGQWETISFTCQQVDCGTPSDVSNSQKTFTSTLAGASVTYTCDSSYTVSPPGASMSLTCQQTGVWETISFSCAVPASPGSSCSTDADCAAISAICLYTGIYSTGSRCYCKALYEYSYSQSVCTQACASYTMLQKYSNEYIKKHNVGDSNGNNLNEAECLKFCEDNYGDSYLSVDHRHAKTWGTNCYCGSVTRKQAQDSSPDLLLSDSQYNTFTKTCN